ncbi:fasciclin domain-containing protein [Fulvivirgaceae bacterium BMA10]|uniref:Fasciclin domain-containing protein n=1 Tax=Splendidivirga corallicola TaxID=3051826 RepID=A0ABT8KSF9_9BACT|nr:fasciclin domain-containing protein [Fulvivirgaceae bacterium BMA10]
MKKINYLIPILVMALLVWSCSGDKQSASNVDTGAADAPPAKIKGQASVSDDVSAKNIVQIAAGSTDHTTLVAAVKAAGLVDVLANNGPLTVFAPTNEAFDKLPDGVVEDLLKPENKMKLVNIIHFHASPGTYKGKLLKDGAMLFQAQGDKVKVERNGDEVTINGAKILATIDATNGVIHVVDQVLLPPEK